MELKDQVVRLELAKKLKELGFTDGSIFHWRRAGNLGWQIEPHYSPIFLEGLYPAYTVAELGEMLGNEEYSKYLMKAYGHVFEVPDTRFATVRGVQLCMANPDLGAKMLIYLAENNLIKL